MTLSTAKKVLAALKKKNPRLQTQRSSAMGDLQRGAHYRINSNQIVVPKARADGLTSEGWWAPEPNFPSSLPPNFTKSHLVSSLHEHGHAADKFAGTAMGVLERPVPLRGRNLQKKQQREPLLTSVTPSLGSENLDRFAQRQKIKLLLEKRANKNVLTEIQKFGTPDQVADWKKYANRQMHGYRNTFLREIHQKQNAARGMSSPLSQMRLSYKRDLLQKFPHLRKSATQLAARLRLRELAARSGRLVEFSVAWATLNPKLESKIRSTFLH